MSDAVGWSLWVALGLVALAGYQAGIRRAARRAEGWSRRSRFAFWCGSATMFIASTPPLVHLAEQGLVVETLQFSVIAFVVAPLLVIGQPFALLWSLRDRAPRTPASAYRTRAGWEALGLFVATTAAWRLPGAVDAVGASGQWFVLEGLTLLAGTWWFWSVVLGSRRRDALEARHLRIALCAIAAWSVWVFAYVVGFAANGFYPLFARGPSSTGAEQAAVVLLWLTSAGSLVPIIFANLSRWLGNETAMARSAPEYRGAHASRAPAGRSRTAGPAT